MDMPTRGERPASSDVPIRHTAGPRRGGRVLLSLVALAMAVGPLGYVAGRYWSDSTAAVDFATAERGGVGYVRPVITLLAALVGAQDAGARGSAPDEAAVRSAIDGVNRVVAGPDVPADLRQSWSQVPDQVEAVLRTNPTGQAAVTGYAAPVGLIQALLHRMGDDSRIVRDPSLDTYHLMDTALFRVPDVIVNAGQLSALVHATAGRPRGQADADGRIAAARDRLAIAGAAVNSGLRMGTGRAGADPGDLDLLRPLDEFVAAVDELTRATPTADQARTVDAAQQRVRQAGLVLDTAALDKLDALLRARTDEVSGQRQSAVAAGALGLFGTGALLLLIVLPRRRSGALRKAAEPTRPAPPDDPARYDPAQYDAPVRTDDGRRAELVRRADLVPAPELAQPGRGAAPRLPR
jgi:hypothetical protein